MRPKLTIGMATYQDFPGVWATVQSLRVCHVDVLKDAELLVVDNSPDSPHGEFVRNLCGWAGCRYIPFPGPVGTAAPRDRIFREAAGEFVLCVDCHVLLWPDSLKRLLAWARKYPSYDLLSGPMVYDDSKRVSTHMADEWRGQMWGTWATDPRGEDPDGPAFEIPAMGLGLFGCRKSAWLGFNPRFRGFGGEEWYIHEKFRRAGAKCLCLPFLRWLHRFGRPDGIPYAPTLWNKVRNYVIGHAELGLPFDRVEEHFRDLLSPGQWEALMVDPHNPPEREPLFYAASMVGDVGLAAPVRR